MYSERVPIAIGTNPYAGVKEKKAIGNDWLFCSIYSERVPIAIGTNPYAGVQKKKQSERIDFLLNVLRAGPDSYRDEPVCRRAKKKANRKGLTFC
ncbi:hypothetical protein DJ568_08190 [Mucilaginibacter hurinus]|uniref:Uncharacterized protein n=1 Tax=Mucilaginibacter hurinus TaxID=2201324 RepID=A0A367GQ01_9SPHI|nr:hypothetical protein DJ568_08190 [Mucilaginibacter hurinus]